MPEFGEALADIRDRLDGPLPIRVSQTRVFITSALTMFGFVTLALHRKVPSPTAMGLPNFKGDDAHVFDAFKALDGLRCNSMQAQQAEELYSDLTFRYHQRNAYEWCLWRNAMQAGMFLSALLMSLLTMGAIMALLTDHLFANMVLLVIFLSIAAIAGILCHWMFQ